MGVLVMVFNWKITATLPRYMHPVFYGLPLLAIAWGLKGGLFSKPVIVIYEDGLAYPQLGLRRLPWQDIRETVLHEEYGATAWLASMLCWWWDHRAQVTRPVSFLLGSILFCD